MPSCVFAPSGNYLFSPRTSCWRSFEFLEKKDASVEQLPPKRPRHKPPLNLLCTELFSDETVQY